MNNVVSTIKKLIDLYISAIESVEKSLDFDDAYANLRYINPRGRLLNDYNLNYMQGGICYALHNIYRDNPKALAPMTDIISQLVLDKIRTNQSYPGFYCKAPVHMNRDHTPDAPANKQSLIDECLVPRLDRLKELRDSLMHDPTFVEYCNNRFNYLGNYLL